MSKIVILGAGFGGISAALKLARKLQGAHSVTLVDRRESFFMGLGKPWALVGARPLEQGTRSLLKLRAPGLSFVQAELSRIDTDARVARTSAGDLAWDHLVIALGAETAPELVPGLPPGSSFYDAANLGKLHDGLAALAQGHVAVLICASPYKCPPAPYETALLLNARMKERGAGKVNVSVFLPEALPMMVAGPRAGERAKALCEAQGIAVQVKHKVARVEDEGRKIVFDDGHHTTCDILLAVPPHRVPACLVESGLAEAGGWVGVDPKTLATKVPGVHAIGDCAGVKLPAGGLLPKAGIFAELEGQLVASRILAELGQGGASQDFDGKGYCYMEAGGGRAMKVQGDFFRDSPDRVDMEEPSEEGYRLKLAFEEERLKDWFE